MSTNANIHTDGHGAYSGLKKEFASHGVVRHDQGEYVNGTVHTNTIEGFWSIMKRGIIGTFHVVSHKHLQRYCDEFSYRYNTREISSSERFFRSISNFGNARLTYAELTA